MKYRNARDVLPEELLCELQKYAEGELIYIPGRRQQKAGWGTLNGSRERYALRNMQMIGHYLRGESIESLSRQYFLSKDSVKKILKANMQA
jgi:Mor family transcriptional regulator